jgi:hypothetical protein
MLRHVVATLAYRGGKTLRGVPEDFAQFQLVPGARTPAQILAHIGDLLDWALSHADGAEKWSNSPPLPWDQGAARFFAALEALDKRLASEAPLGCPPEKLFQGPLADALTHIGQIAVMRRAAGSPVRGENYYIADITAGRVGADQSPARYEF